MNCKICWGADGPDVEMSLFDTLAFRAPGAHFWTDPAPTSAPTVLESQHTVAYNLRVTTMELSSCKRLCTAGDRALYRGAPLPFSGVSKKDAHIFGVAPHGWRTPRYMMGLPNLSVAYANLMSVPMGASCPQMSCSCSQAVPRAPQREVICRIAAWKTGHSSWAPQRSCRQHGCRTGSIRRAVSIVAQQPVLAPRLVGHVGRPFSPVRAPN